MKNDFKNNWSETKESFSKWWARCNDKPLIYAYVKNSIPPKESFQTPENPQDLWVNYMDRLGNEEIAFKYGYYKGDAFPYTCASLGPGAFGVFLGAQPEFMYNTVWYNPCFDDIGDANLRLDPENIWYKWSLENTERAVNRSKGRYLVSFSDFVENLDTLAALFGSEKLLYYLCDAPDEVHRLQQQMMPLWYEAYEAHYNLIKDEVGWSSYSHFGLWGPGRVAKLQCDISAVISPSMFDEFVLPYLKEQCDWLDHSIYHLDGPDAISHLDSLLAIESLDCINWVAGAGNPDESNDCWFDMYKKILDAGKCLHLYYPPDKVTDLIKRLGNTGIYILTSTDTVQEADELLKSCEII
jgi:hypothetical protein